MEELVNNEKDFKIALLPGSSLVDFFKFAEEDIWQKAWKNQIQPYLEDYKNLNRDGVEYLMENSKVALYSHFQMIRTYPEYKKCEIIAIPRKYNFQPLAFGFQKDSPYLDIFNFYLKEMIEKGVMKASSKKYEGLPQICPDLNGAPLGFESCFAAFLALILGLIMAFILMTIEVIVGKLVSKHTFPIKIQNNKIVQTSAW